MAATGSGLADTKSRGDGRGPIYAIAAILFVFAFGYRFLSLELTDDDYQFPAVGRHIAVFGEWPIVDLVEEGRPLHLYVSALWQAVFGYRLIGEVVFDLLMLSAAASLAFLLAVPVARSRGLAAMTAVWAVLMAPRLYDYPKAILPLICVWLSTRYMQDPTGRKAFGLGLLTGIAFLYRYDLGVFAGVTSAAAILAHHASASTLPAMPVWRYCAALLLILVPYASLLQANGGLLTHVAAAQRFVARETTRSDDPRPAFAFDWSRALWERNPGLAVNVRWADNVDDDERSLVERQYGLQAGRRADGRTWKYLLVNTDRENLRAMLADPRVEDTANIDRSDRGSAPASLAERARRVLRAPPQAALAPGVLTRQNAVAWLYYLLVVVTYGALLALAVQVVRQRSLSPAMLLGLPAVVWCAAAAPMMLRGNMYENTRLADLAFPAAVMFAWLLGLACWRVDRRVGMVMATRFAAAVVILLTFASTAAFAQVKRRADDALVVLDPPALAGQVRSVTADMLASPPPLHWLSKETGLRGAAAYLRRCTAADDRVFVYGYYPDIVYFGGRASAADQVFVLRGFWAHPDEQRRTVAAMMRHPMPVALVEAQAVGTSSPDRALDDSLAIIDKYLVERYTLVGTTAFGGSTGRSFHVWVDKQRAPSGTDAEFSLPCFQPVGSAAG